VVVVVKFHHASQELRKEMERVVVHRVSEECWEVHARRVLGLAWEDARRALGLVWEEVLSKVETERKLEELGQVVLEASLQAACLDLNR